MTREELRAIEGMTDEQINAIMALHGRDTNAANAERDALQTQLNTAQQGLAAFEGVDVNDLRGQITTLRGQLSEQAQRYAFDSVLRREARAAGALDEDDVIALLPGQDNLRASQDQSADVAAAFTALKSKKPYLFKAADPEPQPQPQPEPARKVVVPKPKTPGSDQTTVADFALMSGIQRMELRAKNPTLFQQLMSELRGYNI